MVLALSLMGSAMPKMARHCDAEHKAMTVWAWLSKSFAIARCSGLYSGASSAEIQSHEPNL